MTQGVELAKMEEEILGPPGREKKYYIIDWNHTKITRDKIKTRLNSTGKKYL